MAVESITITAALDSQLREILHECQRDGLSREEMRTIFAPLVTHLSTLGAQNGGHGHKSLEWMWGRWIVVLGLLVVVAAVFLGPQLQTPSSSSVFGLFQSLKTEITSKALVLARLLLIRLLPYWDWTDLYYSRCLLRNPYYQDTKLGLDDCALCENLDEIEILTNVTPTQVVEEYLQREKPFIVTDAMVGWPVMEESGFWFDNVTELFLDDNLGASAFVCNLNTNLRPPAGGSSPDLSKLINKLYSPHTRNWFVHWENCQKEGAKAVRSFYRRPYFISNTLDFTGSNWVLMSSEFRGRIYKSVPITERLSLLYQLRGENHIRLSPREACRGYCPELTVTVREGEVLVVTHYVWVLEYIPGGGGDNLAVISEVAWEGGE